MNELEHEFEEEA